MNTDFIDFRKQRIVTIISLTSTRASRSDW